MFCRAQRGEKRKESQHLLLSAFLSVNCVCIESLVFDISTFDLNLCFQVSQDGKALLDVLQRPLSPGNSESLTATANYSKAVSASAFMTRGLLQSTRVSQKVLRKISKTLLTVLS